MSQKDLLPILRELKSKGWSVINRKTGAGHRRVVAPSGATLTISATPSDWRVLHKIRADIRRIEGRAEV